MNPSPAKGKARRKPCMGNPSARFDEEVEVERPLLYSTMEIFQIDESLYQSSMIDDVERAKTFDVCMGDC
jgi:hypothetical protein